MSEITIHHLPITLSEKLQQRARQHGNSVEAEIITILESVLNAPSESGVSLVDTIEQRFSAFGDFDIPEIPREPIRPALDLS